MREMRQEAAPAPRRDIALLANVRVVGAEGAARSVCFANVIELGPAALVLESNREYAVGETLEISLVFPGIARGANPIVSLSCLVRRALDEANLHYDVQIEAMNDSARHQLLQYLAKSPASGEPA